jgi:hypothetical protein
MPSRGLTPASQPEAGLSLEKGNDLARKNIHFVFGALVGSEFAFVALAGQKRDTSLRLAVGLEAN